MDGQKPDCVICQGPVGDQALARIEIWEDEHWRLTTSLSTEVLGFSYLEPKRHIPHITDLNGEEARTLGEVLARVTRALREETSADLVYVYVFGSGVPHLHFHLAPHRTGDALNDQIIKGEIVAEKAEGGAVRMVSKDYPLLPEKDQLAVATRVRKRLSSVNTEF